MHGRIQANSDQDDFHLSANASETSELRLLAADNQGEEEEHLLVKAGELNAVTSGGSIYLTALDAVHSGRLEANNGALQLWGTNDLGKTLALEIQLQDSLDLRGENIQANILHTANPAPLEFQLSNYEGEQLQTARLKVDAEYGLVSERFYGQEIYMETTATTLDLNAAQVSHYLEFLTPKTHGYVNNQGADRHPDADLHLYQPGGPDFYLQLDGRYAYTDASVVYYAGGYEVEVPNYQTSRQASLVDAEGRSAERQTTAELLDYRDPLRAIYHQPQARLVEYEDFYPGELERALQASEAELTNAVTTAFGEPLETRKTTSYHQRRAAQIQTLVQAEHVTFGFDSTELPEESEAFLREVGLFLMEQPDRKILIEGHSDQLGDPDYNLWLSQQRAGEVRSFLLRMGVDSSQIQVEARGADSVLLEGDDRDTRQYNRRVEIHLLPEGDEV